MRRAVISVCHLVGARIIEAQSTFGVSSISVSSSDLGARDLSLREGFGGMIFRHRLDTTSDTTQCATLRNSGQTPAMKSAYLSRFCNSGQHLETGFGGLWLRRSQARPLMVSLLNDPRFAGQDGSKDNSQVFISKPFQKP